MPQSMSEAEQSYHYRATTGAGQAVTGAIDAADPEAARRLLESMGLEVREVETAGKPARRGRLDGTAFVAFNQQLAALTDVGLPVEAGLRLIAHETRSGRMNRSITEVADRVERGTPLGQAFEVSRSQFPPLYGRLIDAGIAAGNLPGMLYDLGRHMQLLRRLRATLWQAVAYPLAVLTALSLVILLMSALVFPQFSQIFADFDTDMPGLTVMMIDISVWLPWVMLGLVVLILLTPLLWGLAVVTGVSVIVADAFGLVIPLIGGVLRCNLRSRWFDTVRISVEAGLDLPVALRLASEAIGSPTLEKDSARLIGGLEQGKPLTSVQGLKLIPASATTAMQLAADQGRLPEALATLTELYRQQAESRVGIINVILAPLMLLFLAMVLGFFIAAMFLPLIRITQSVM